MIPEELTALNQWVCADASKRPLNPRNGRSASPTDSRTWGSYEQACRFAAKSDQLYVGFVLTKDDPYCIIDLDKPANEEQKERHSNIVASFDTYTETSMSGNGVHIIMKGKTPKGFKRDNVEIYSSERYMITTGRTINGHNVIQDRQELVNKIVLQMDNIAYSKVNFIDIRGINPWDIEDLHNKILANAYVHDEYDLLCQGDWNGRLNYQSQSDADFNLAMIICEHTEDDELAKKLFTLTKMYREDKPKPYLDYTFTRARAKTPPPMPQATFNNLINNKKESPKPPPKRAPKPVRNNNNFPPGLIGDIASYIYSSSFRPVKEYSLAAAIGLVAGIAARSYTVSGTGLNMYLAVLGGTGTGKEGMANGIDTLRAAVAKETPSIEEFAGPSSFSSGQALMKHIAEQPCFLSLFAEFGLVMQTMSGDKAGAHMLMYRRAMLDLYTKSGPHSAVRPTIYAKKEDSSEMVKSPNVTLLGESTPEAFYSALSEDLIAEGLIPRYMVIEYKGKRVAKNENAFHPPPPELVRNLAALTMTACHTANNGTCGQITITSEAAHILDEFDVHADNKINENKANEVRKQLWNRAHLKALRLAALVAVGCDIHNPTVTQQTALWSINFVRADIANIIEKFEEGSVGSGHEKHEAEIRKVINEYFDTSKDILKGSYKVSPKILGKPVIPYNYIRRRLKGVKAFKVDNRGAAVAIQDAIKDLLTSEILIQLPKDKVSNEFGLSSVLYVKGPQW